MAAEHTGDEDPLAFLRAAEKEMAEHEVELFMRLFDAITKRVSIPETEDEMLTMDEIRAVFEQALEEDPELRELAERSAVLQQFRRQGQTLDDSGAE